MLDTSDDGLCWDAAGGAGAEPELGPAGGRGRGEPPRAGARHGARAGQPLLLPGAGRPPRQPRPHSRHTR